MLSEVKSVSVILCQYLVHMLSHERDVMSVMNVYYGMLKWCKRVMVVNVGMNAELKDNDSRVIMMNFGIVLNGVM
jgi:hypothetical protein